MPVDYKNCVVKGLFSVKLSQRFNTFAVNKIFKYVLHPFWLILGFCVFY